MAYAEYATEVPRLGQMDSCADGGWLRAVLPFHNAHRQPLLSSAQLKIQKAVEGFSLIAISYYLAGLLKLTLRGLAALGAPFSSKVLFALLAPLFLLTLLLLARRLKIAVRH